MPRIELAKLAEHIDRHDSDKRLFDFFHVPSFGQNRDLLDRYRGGDRRAVAFYAAALRHVYVHGHLTANPNKCAAQEVTSTSLLNKPIICTQLDVLPQSEVEPMRIGIISPSRIRRRS